MIVETCQRWRDRGEERVPAASFIDPTTLSVDVLEERAARPFVEQHHYSGTFPAARLSVGLFRRTQLVGVAVFSVPMNNLAVPAWTGLDQASAGVELGRLVLLDDVEGNGESWFMARALGLLAREKRVEAVLSYSDPVPRLNAHGSVVKPGHVGTVYQALSATYRGLSGKRTGYLLPGGQVSGRMLSKLRLDECGAAGAADFLMRLGADARQAGETGAAWVDRLRRDGQLRTFRHPGNHAYVFPLSGRARSRVRRNLKVDKETERSNWPRLSYPKVST